MSQESLIIVENTPKVGAALTVENTVQAVLDKPETTVEQLDQLQSDLWHHIRGKGVTGQYERAKRFRQAVYAVATLFQSI
jgi:hypothetical protein